MASYSPALLLPTIVSAGNRWIDFTETTKTYAASIATGTYYSLDSLRSAVQTAIDNKYTAAITVTVSTAFTGDGTFPAWGFCYNFGNSVAFKFATGVHAGSSAYSILGFSKTDHSASDEQGPDYNMPCVWLPNRPPARDSYDRREHIGGEARRTLSGKYVKRLTVSTPRRRKIEFEAIHKSRTLARTATGTFTNCDFETWWQRAIEGEYFAYFNDWTTAATAAKSSGNYYLTDPSDLSKAIERPNVDYESYNFTLDLVRRES